MTNCWRRFLKGLFKALKGDCVRPDEHDLVALSMTATGDKEAVRAFMAARVADNHLPLALGYSRRPSPNDMMACRFANTFRALPFGLYHG